MNKKHLLTETDIAYIRSKLSRLPSETELNVISKLSQFEINLRPYLHTLARMDQETGWRGAENPSVEYEGRTEVTIDKKGEPIFGDELGQLPLICKGVEPLIQLSGTSKSFPRIHTTTTMGLRSSVSRTIPNSDGSLFMIRSDEIEKLEDLVIQWQKRAWIYRMFPVTFKGLAATILEEIADTDYGITLESEDETIFDHHRNAVVILVQNGFEKEIMTEVQHENCFCGYIGKLESASNIVWAKNGQKVVSIPISIFDFIWNSQRSHIHQNAKDVDKDTVDMNTVDEPDNFNLTLKILLKTLKTRRKTDKRVIKYSSLSDKIIISTSDSEHFTQLDSRIGGKLAVADAVRQSICIGANPESVIVHNILPIAEDGNEDWKGIELLQGQEEAIRMSNLTVISRQLLPRDNLVKQHITVIGKLGDNSADIGRGFVSSGDFITMLGSHRGEFGGSLYLRGILKKNLDQLPMVDLGMESRLRDVILQGIQSGYLRSASMVSEGGLAVAIAESLRASDKGLGARIHLSRKMRNDELLFGETQGLIVISLEEKNIMEFERLCMSGGVPSTTIGRVTDDGLYTFNDEINIAAAELRKI